MQPHSRSRRLVAGLLLLLLPPLVSAQNLVVNSGFESSPITGWLDVGTAGTRQWSPDDINAAPGSGSAEFQASSAGEAVGLAQCIAINGATDYDYYARLKFPTGQTSSESRALIDLQFFASSDCSGQALGAEGQGAVTGTAYTLDDAVWRGIPGEADMGVKGRATSPDTALSALLRIYLEQISGSSAHVVRFDEVVLHDAATIPVTLQSFQVE